MADPVPVWSFNSSQQRRQMRDQRLVRRRHRVVPKLVRPHPGEPAWPFARHLSLPAPADIERHQQMEVGIGVAREGQRRETGFPDDDSEFLLQFPDQRLLRAVSPASTLPPGNSHRPAIALPGGRSRDQHAAVGIDEGAGGDKDEFGAHDLDSNLRSGGR